ncbi:MAG: DUF1565 domain-containing protein, partial [Cyanobacteria bacterium P01_H01_bin.121]
MTDFVAELARPIRFYVDPVRGDDQQSGVQGQPVKTIQRAIAIATPDSTIQLATGTYSLSTGETF